VTLALRGKRGNVRGHVVEALLLLMLLLSLLILVTLLVGLFQQGWPVLAGRKLTFLTGNLSSLPERAGIAPAITGSLILMGFVIAVAFPLGIGAAVYLEEYARDTWPTRAITTTVRNLAGVPSIVYGILGLVIFVQWLRPITGPGGANGRTLISGGLTLAVLVMPIVIITTAEALRAVPGSIREAAYAVGATRWEVVRSHVLPYAAPGILTGTILSLARAFGETAPLLLVGAVTGFIATGSAGFLQTIRDAPYTSLPTIIFSWSTLPREEFRTLTAAAIIVLLVVILLVNTVAIVLRNRYERKW